MKYRFLLPVLFLSFSFILSAQDKDIPERPEPQHLVNDFAGFLSSEEVNGLEYKLDEFNNTTSTQIAVVIVKSLNGYEINDFATRVMEKWGIGQKNKNNGVLILIKPKTPDEKGEVFITTGYGVEHLITDAVAKAIVDKEIIPSFQQGNNYQGIDKAVNTIMSLTRGEFTADQYMAKPKKKSGKGIFIIVIIIIIIISIFGRKGGGDGTHMSSRGDLPLWMLLSMMNSRGSRGSFGGFSSGGGFGGSGGGFGGFGGGLGGGGGAGGSW